MQLKSFGGIQCNVLVVRNVNNFFDQSMLDETTSTNLGSDEMLSKNFMNQLHHILKVSLKFCPPNDKDDQKTKKNYKNAHNLGLRHVLALDHTDLRNQDNYIAHESIWQAAKTLQYMALSTIQRQRFYSADPLFAMNPLELPKIQTLI